MGFSAYWKEIAVVLAAVFAIVGAVFDVRDKRSGQITNWGRIFFLLTILSMIGGFYAQWQDTAKEEADNLEAQKKTLQAQRDTLTIIRNTQTSVHDLSRLLFPIGKPTVSISLQLNCSVQRYVRFCKEVGETADRSPRDEISRMNDMLVMTSEQVDWSSWPSYDYSKGLRSPIYIAFFKDSTAAEEFLDPDKAAKPDMELLEQIPTELIRKFFPDAGPI